MWMTEILFSYRNVKFKKVYNFYFFQNTDNLLFKYINYYFKVGTSY